LHTPLKKIIYSLKNQTNS